MLGDSGLANEAQAELTAHGNPKNGSQTVRTEVVKFFNRVPGGNIQSTLRLKIKVVRWLTNRIAEYDVTNDFWTSTEARMVSVFRPFS